MPVPGAATELDASAPRGYGGTWRRHPRTAAERDAGGQALWGSAAVALGRRLGRGCTGTKRPGTTAGEPRLVGTIHAGCGRWGRGEDARKTGPMRKK